MTIGNTDFSGDIYLKAPVSKLHNTFRYTSVIMGLFGKLAQKNGLSLTEMKILHGLRYNKHPKQSDIAKEYALSRKTVNTAIKKMAMGVSGTKKPALIRISPQGKMITLTDEGIKAADKIEQAFQEFVKALDARYPSQAGNKIHSFNVSAKVFIAAITEETSQKG